MHKKVWSFLQIEKDIWMVVSVFTNHEVVNNQNNTGMNNSSMTSFGTGSNSQLNQNNPNVTSASASRLYSDQIISSTSLNHFLHHFYNLYYMLYGSIHGYILGGEKKGYELVDKIMLKQRAIRKMKKKISIIESDEEKRRILEENRINQKELTDDRKEDSSEKGDGDGLNVENPDELADEEEDDYDRASALGLNLEERNHRPSHTSNTVVNIPSIIRQSLSSPSHHYHKSLSPSKTLGGKPP
jgi:hypothetical protein